MIKRPYNAFWGEMSAFEHFVQIYEQEETFLDTLADFLGSGLFEGSAVIAIVTDPHRIALLSRLKAMGIAVNFMQSEDQLIFLDADETIAKFMVSDWPDEKAFENVVTDVLKRAAKNGRKVRAFGEMVALMWARGQCAATVRLEHLWTDLCKKQSLPLFCAYPKTGFTESPTESVAHLCSLHSTVIE